MNGITATGVTPGNHQIVVGVDCPDGDPVGTSLPSRGIVGVLLGG